MNLSKRLPSWEDLTKEEAEADTVTTEAVVEGTTATGDQAIEMVVVPPVAKR